jgi:hypothetical protein
LQLCSLQLVLGILLVLLLVVQVVVLLLRLQASSTPHTCSCRPT